MYNYTKTKTKFQVVFYGDSVTDSYVVGTYSTRMRASNKATKLDNEYGAIGTLSKLLRWQYNVYQ